MKPMVGVEVRGLGGEECIDDDRSSSGNASSSHPLWYKWLSRKTKIGVRAWLEGLDMENNYGMAI